MNDKGCGIIRFADDTACPLIATRGQCTARHGVFDMDDHARLPWRFFGASKAVPLVV